MIKIISKDGKERIWKRSVKKKLSTLNNNKCKLPKYIQDNTLWVTDEHRKNPLSLEEGGSNVIVEYYKKKVLGYKRIKFPSSYVKKILGEEVFNIYEGFEYYTKLEKNTILKKVISTIHACKYNENTYNEVWNSTNSHELPWESLEAFDYPRKNKFNYKKYNKYNDVEY